MEPQYAGLVDEASHEQRPQGVVDTEVVVVVDVVVVVAGLAPQAPSDRSASARANERCRGMA